MIKELTLTRADRCDRCGAQAMVAVLLPLGGDQTWPLNFCKHHFEKHEGALPEDAFVCADDRETLV